jgi:FtsZ-interacting cell division protein ZipA
MATWVIILIVIGAVVIAAILVYSATRGRESRLNRRRVEADEHRDRARRRAEQAEERERAAQLELQSAQRARTVAREHERLADDVDPDVDR